MLFLRAALGHHGLLSAAGPQRNLPRRHGQHRYCAPTCAVVGSALVVRRQGVPIVVRGLLVRASGRRAGTGSPKSQRDGEVRGPHHFPVAVAAAAAAAVLLRVEGPKVLAEMTHSPHSLWSLLPRSW